MFRTVRFALLAAPLLLTACAKNPKAEPRAEEYSYTPTPTARSTDTTTGTSATPYTPGTNDTGSTYTATTYTPPSNPAPAPATTTYSPPPANSGGDTYGSSSTTMRVADEPLSPAKSRSRSNGSAANGKTYTVKKGDTLGGIAQKYYGNASKWERIYNANKAKVSDPKKLKVGTKLIIP